MIKILFYIETLERGGAEKVLRDLVNHMDQTQFEITVQTVWPCNAAKLLAPGIHYKTTFHTYNRVNRMIYRLEAELGILYRLHVKDDYDIECAYLEMGPTKVLAASTNKKAKKLAWVHCDLLRSRINRQYFVEKNEKLYQKYDMVVCVSETVKSSFDSLFHNQFPSVVVHNYVDDSSIKRKAADKMDVRNDQTHPILLAVGTLYPPKNYPRLLRAHHRLISEGIDHELWILGDGEDRPKLERFVSDNHLNQSVRFFGFVENPYPYICNSDILVCSSNYEGYSTVVTEGLILGKPIVTTDCSGMKEQLGDSEYGLITENNDEAFYLGVKKMLVDSKLRRHYSEKSAERGKLISGKEQILSMQTFFNTLIYQKQGEQVR